MLELFLGINIGLSFIILFTNSMIQNHFKKIHRNISVYADKKVYKSQTDTQFLDTLLERYYLIIGYNQQELDVEVLVSKSFYEERVGKFRYTLIESIAIHGKAVMWTLMASQIGIELLTQLPSYPKRDFIMIIANTLLCMIITLMSVIRSVPEEREKLITRISDYVVNTYPAEVEWQKQQQNIRKLEQKIEELQEELESSCKEPKINKVQESKKEVIESKKELLKERDIVTLLDKFKLV